MQASKQIKGVSIAFPVEDSSMKIILNHEGGGKWRQRSGWVDDASLCYPHSNLPSPRMLSIHTHTHTVDTHAGSGWPCAAIPTLRHQTATQENQPQKQEQTNKKKQNLIDDDFHICTRLHC